MNHVTKQTGFVERLKRNGTDLHGKSWLPQQRPPLLFFRDRVRLSLSNSSLSLPDLFNLTRALFPSCTDQRSTTERRPAENASFNHTFAFYYKVISCVGTFELRQYQLTSKSKMPINKSHRNVMNGSRTNRVPSKALNLTSKRCLSSDLGVKSRLKIKIKRWKNVMTLSMHTVFLSAQMNISLATML